MLISLEGIGLFTPVGERCFRRVAVLQANIWFKSHLYQNLVKYFHDFCAPFSLSLEWANRYLLDLLITNVPRDEEKEDKKTSC